MLQVESEFYEKFLIALLPVEGGQGNDEQGKLAPTDMKQTGKIFVSENFFFFMGGKAYHKIPGQRIVAKNGGILVASDFSVGPPRTLTAYADGDSQTQNRSVFQQVTQTVFVIRRQGKSKKQVVIADDGGRRSNQQTMGWDAHCRKARQQPYYYG